MTQGTEARADALAAELLAQLQRSQAARLDELGGEPLTWLAVAPLWTDRLARACGFPEHPLPLPEFLTRAETAGWCARRPGERRARTPHLRLQVQAELLPHLSAAEQRAALDEVLGIEGEVERAALLALLVPNLPADLLAEVSDAIWGSSGAVSVPVLLALAVRAQPPLRSRVIRELTGRIAEIEDPEERAARLVELSQVLPDEIPAATTRLTWEQLVEGERPPLRRSRREDLICRLVPWVALVSPGPVEEEMRWRLREHELAAAARLLRAADNRLDLQATIQFFEQLSQSVRGLPAGIERDLALDDLTTTAVAAPYLSHRSALIYLALVEEIADVRIRLHALTELTALNEPDAPEWHTDVEARWVTAATRPDGTLDLVAVARHVERHADALHREHVREHAHLAAGQAGRTSPSPVVVAALQQIAQSLGPRNQETAVLARGLLDAAADLARRLGDAVPRAAALTSTARLYLEVIGALPAHPALDEPALIDAARLVHDEEERIWALARLVPVVAERARRRLIDEALALSEQLDDAGTVTFWIPEGARGELLAELQRRGFNWLRVQVVIIARAVLDARQRVTAAIPPALARWAELAASVEADRTDGSTRQVAAQLDRRIDGLLDVGDTGQALTWLDTARALAPLLGGEFEVSVLANTRRVELVHRRWLDRRRLERFLHRDEQIVAFGALLRQPAAEGDPWALHYLGVGGVGKTMLIRYLTAVEAPAANAVTSRIDFDHLNPDFPRRRPAQILVELATDLEAQAQDSRLDYLFRRAWEYLQEINARARPAAVADDDFAAALRAFAGFLQALDRPVVLVLDTCEELEKFRPAGGRLEQLEATFQILEALHQQVPALRVVLAGRRPLARAGHGWRLPPGPAGQGNVLLPESKPYLLLHDVRGFDRTEAERFLINHAGLRADRALLEAILERSPDPGSAADLFWDDGHRPPQVPRYNPFDLDLYAGWVRAEPGMDAAALRGGGSDHYVEARIVGRLKNPEVERLLPAVLALRRFDRDMLRLAFDGAEDALVDAERELASSEWIDVQPDAALDTTFLEVDRSLHPRLEAHFQRERRGELATASRRLAPGLAAMVDSRRPDRLSVEHVAAALRLLDPPDAARLVDRLAMRVIEDAAWGWAATVGERLLALDSPLADHAHPAAAGLRAMLASALLHQDPDRDLVELWAVVEQTAANHPDPEVGTWLAQRAFLKLLTPESGRERLAPLAASLREPGTTPEADRRRQILTGGALSALQNLLDLAEASDDPSQLPAQAVFRDVAAPGVGTGAAAFAEMLGARSRLLRGDFDAARAGFEAAVAGLEPEEQADDPSLTSWLRADWEPPADLNARIWLEAVRNPLAAATPAFADPDWMPPDRPVGIDAERLASVVLDRRLAHGLVPAETLERSGLLGHLDDVRRPACEAHRAVPPLFVNVARGWMTLGWAQRALAVLQRAERAAVEHRDQAAADAAALARLEVVRRFRLADQARPSRQRMLRSRNAPDRWSAWAVGVLVDPPEELPPPGAGASPAEWHAWWRIQPAATAAQAAPEVLAQVQGDRLISAASHGFAALSLELDGIEARLCSQADASFSMVVDASAWVAEHPSQAEAAARLALRQRVLCDSRISLSRWVEEFGARRVAELALDEGELLALRLPAAAAGLLEVAEHLFGKVGDPTGAFVSLLAAALVAPSRRQRSELLQAYSALSADPAGPPLPDFDELTLGPTTTPPPYLRHPDWGGWLARLKVIQALSSGLPGLARQVLSLTFPSGAPSAEVLGPVATETGMPPDITGAMAPVAPPQQSQPEAAPQPSPQPAAASPEPQSPWQPAPGAARSSYSPGASAPPPPAAAAKRRRRSLPLIAGVATLLVLVSALLVVVSQGALSRLTVGNPPSTVGNPPPGGTGILWWAVLGGALALLLVAGAGLVFRGRQRVPRGIRRLVDVLVPVEELVWVDAMGADEVRLMSRKGIALAAPPGFGPYGTQPRPVPWPLSPRVGLEVPQELAHLPWEALLLPGMSRSLGTRRRSCWREPDSVSAGGLQPWWRPGQPYSVLASPRWLPLLQANLGQVHDGDQPIWEEPAGRPMVVVGTPVETSAGTQLLVERPDGGRTLVLPEFPPGRPPGLVIIMGEPSESLTRVDAEREAAADLRRCAADLFAGGAGAILCLPSMPPELAGATLMQLDQRLQRAGRPRGRPALITITADLRTLIERGVPKSDPPREAARELSMEVTLFVRRKRRGKTR